MTKMIGFHTTACAAVLAALCVLLVSGGAECETRFSIRIEGGAVFAGYNDVRIPGSTGTLFSLTDDLETESSFAYRGRISLLLGDRHLISLLAAPLSLDASGSIDRPIDYEGETFDAGTPIDATYRFDSYRLTYRYEFYGSERLTAGVGVTGKIRDAAISLSSGEKRAEKTNVGFVPLINFSVAWQMFSRLGLILEGDALAAPQGRAEDVLLALRFDLAENALLHAGYRILEGGADNDEVYNFALLHYLVFGVELAF